MGLMKGVTYSNSKVDEGENLVPTNLNFLHIYYHWARKEGVFYSTSLLRSVGM